uniref:Uncharacterized protein n=1 Tax=Arundo donax TaxID=35708 RepID=A0A0A9F0R9_ARUDO
MGMIWIFCYRYVPFKFCCTLTLNLFIYCFR